MHSVLEDIQQQLASLKDEHEVLERHHHAIRSAVNELLEVAYKEGHHEVAELAHLLANHERIESDIESAVHELAILRSH